MCNFVVSAVSGDRPASFARTCSHFGGQAQAQYVGNRYLNRQ